MLQKEKNAEHHKYPVIRDYKARWPEPITPEHGQITWQPGPFFDAELQITDPNHNIPDQPVKYRPLPNLRSRIKAALDHKKDAV